MKEPNLHLKISNPETSEVLIPFQKEKASDIPTIKLTFCNTTITTKKENVEFYNYMEHLEKYGFLWKDSALELRYSVEFSRDKKKKISKKNDYGKKHLKKIIRR